MEKPVAKISIQVQIVLTVFFTLTSCSQYPETTEEYVNKINRWHQHRIESLKEKDSWLSLVGLYWLETGVNTFGSDSSNDIVFPEGKAPGYIGRLVLREGEVYAYLNPDAEVLVNKVPVSGTIPIVTDAEGEPTTLAHGSLRWYLIERGKRIGIRLKDIKNPELSSFDGIDRYPVAAKWRIEAKYEKFDEPKTIRLPNILGDLNKEPIYGTLEFEIDGRTYRLDPLGTPEDDKLFVVFGDKTNGEATYGGGRYVYVNSPGADGLTYIDFNKAYNPPCVFNKFATCPLPPTQNKLPVSITAGEKNYKHKSG